MKRLIITAIAVSLLFVAACSNSPAKHTVREILPSKEFTVGQEKIILEAKNLLNNKVQVLIPKTFVVMPEEMAKLKYPSEKRPSLIYTSEDGSVNIAVNHTDTRTSDDQIDQYKQGLKKLLADMHPTAAWYSDEVLKIDEKNVGVLEVLTPAIDTNIYNLMFFTELDGRLLLGTFNCTEEQMKDWKPIAKEIMNSLRTY